MKLYRYIFATLLAIVAFSATAQSIDPVIEVNGLYNVDLGEIHKPYIDNRVEDSLSRFDISFDYSMFERPYQNLYEFAPYSYTKIRPPQKDRNVFLYFDAGCQSGLLPSANLALQTVAKKNIAVDLFGSFRGWYHLPLVIEVADEYSNPFQRRTKGEFGGDLKYAWRSGESKIGASYRLLNDKFLYDVYNSTQFTAFAGARSANTVDTNIEYDFLASFNNLKLNESLCENLINIDGIVATSFDVHRVYLDVNMENASYTEPKSHHAWILEFAPMYEYNSGRLAGKFGVRFGSRFRGNSVESNSISDHQGNLTNIFPEIDAKVSLIKNRLWLHAIVTGKNYMNSISSLVNLNPVISSESELRFGHTPLDASLKIESSFGGIISMNICGGYAIEKNKMAIGLSDDISERKICATYWDMKQLYAGLETLLKVNHFKFIADARWTQCKDYYENVSLDILPKYNLKASAEFDIRNRLFFSANCDYASDTRFVKSYTDLDFNVSFILNKHISVYAKCANLLDAEICRNLYLEPERNFGGGLTVSF